MNKFMFAYNNWMKEVHKHFNKSLWDYVEKFISKSWEISPYNEFGGVRHRIMLKLDEVNSVFVFAKKNNFNVHLCFVSCIKTLNDANFDLQNSLSFSCVIASTNIVKTPTSLEMNLQSSSSVLLISPLLFYSIRILDTIDMYVNSQKDEDVRGMMLSQEVSNSNDQLKFKRFSINDALHDLSVMTCMVLKMLLFILRKKVWYPQILC